MTEESGHCTSIINLTYQDGSEGSPSNPAKYNNQDYNQLKKTYQRRNKLFVDSTFPPDNRSLGDLPDMSSWREAQVKWLRPADILKMQNIRDEPVFCKNGASRFDFAQGSVGNCWFLAAISSLTFHQNLMVQVVPMEQTFNRYAGIFHFRFWRFGKWMDVVIDDYLPTLGKNLLSVRSKSGNEFWVPLLEKAYAKVCGSYADMNAGLPSEAFMDFSGGVSMIYRLREDHGSRHDEHLWQQLERATECDSMICCGTAPKGGELVNTVAHTGLVDAHAYSVTGVTEVSYYGSKVRLVRVMNPWGQQEWNGKWSDSSNVWSSVSAADQEKCRKSDNGEFWIELEDFCYYFVSMFICCENPNFIDGDLSCQWKCQIYEGSWVAGTSAGGNVNEYSFEKNPQYRIQVAKTDSWKKGDKNMLFSLMQKPQRAPRNERRFHPIGLTIYKVPPGASRGRLRRSFFRTNPTVKDGQRYSYDRNVTEFHSLEPGEYVVIPSTMKPHMSSDFVLTVYSKADTKINHYHEDDEGENVHDHEEEESLILPEIPGDEEEEEEPAEKDPLHAMFKRYAFKDELSARQLQKLLNENLLQRSWNGFYLDTCRRFIALMDTDRNMRMRFSEFSKLWSRIEELTKLFKQSDLNKDGSLTESEVKRAIQSLGMDISDNMLRLMMIRYADFSDMSLEGFISLIISMDRMSVVFTQRSSDSEMHLNYEDWSDMFLYG